MEHGHALLIRALQERRGEWLGRGGIRVLEVGSSREPLPNQDSTKILARFCQERDWEFTTCDMDPENTARAAKLFADLGADFSAVTALGEEYIASKRKAFDVVYLDAYDFDHGGHSEHRQQRYEEFLGARIDQHACEVMHLKAMQGLNQAGRRRCLVVIDDTWRDGPDSPWLGKGPLAVPWALRNGWRIALESPDYRAVALELESPPRRLLSALRRAVTPGARADAEPVSAVSALSDLRTLPEEGDEEQALRTTYARLVERLDLPETVSVLQIGAADAPSAAALSDVLGARLSSQRVVDDVADVATVEDRSLDLVLAQSSWSHLDVVEQYRYLRDLRDKLKHRAPVVVSGLFLLGSADRWTWNRFRRRVHQVEQGIAGQAHEFTSVSALTEILARLGYEDITVLGHGFVARRGGLVLDQYHAELPEGIDYQYRASFDEWLKTGTTVAAHLPPTPQSAATGPGPLARAGNGVRRGARKLKRRLG